MLSKWLEGYRLQRTLQQGATRTLTDVLIGGVVAAISGMVLARILMTLTQVLIARQLGALLYGEYTTLTTSLGLLASLLGMGLDTWVLREGAHDPDSLTRNVWHVFLIKIAGAIGLLILLGMAWSNHIVRTPIFVIGVVGIIFDSFALTGYAALRATRHNPLVAVFQTLSPLLLLLALLGFEPISRNVLLLVSIQAVLSVLLTIVLIRYLRRVCLPLAKFHFTPWRFIRQAWLFVAADIFANIYSQAGIAILSLAAAAATVGIFKLALNTVSFMFLAPSLMFAVGLPLLNTPNISRRDYSDLVRNMALGAALYGLVAFAALWFAGGYVIRVLYGAQYDAALPFVRIMSLAPLFKSGSFVCVAVLLAHDQQRLRVILQGVAVAVSVIGGFALIPQYDANGAAWLYVAIELLLFTLYFFGARFVQRQMNK